MGMELLQWLVLLFPLLAWAGLLALPWQPWRTRESWEPPATTEPGGDLCGITVLTPARNEAAVLEHTLPALTAQSDHLKVILINDRSTDATASAARRLGGDHLRLLEGAPRPKGWSGKLWALQQGLQQVDTPYVLLLDADIQLRAGVISGLHRKMRDERLDFVSLMARPSLHNFWERLLMPAFVYFFKLLYPFGPSNAGSRWVAAGAGGCILVKTEALRSVDAFRSIRETLIDDCALARQMRQGGFRTWIGLTLAARSVRPYQGLREIWDMVARTAYTQLRHSSRWLGLCTLLMLLTMVLPVTALFSPNLLIAAIGLLALLFMFISYLPTLRYYGLSAARTLSLPAVGVLFLAMTWTSAIRYWRGERARWRGRVVYKDPSVEEPSGEMLGNVRK